MLLDGPGDQRAVVVRTEWDSPDDAAEFEAILSRFLAWRSERNVEFNGCAGADTDPAALQPA